MTDKTVVTAQGEEWVLEPLNDKQAAVARAQAAVQAANLKTQLKEISEELYTAGCGSFGAAAFGCQTATAAGMSSPITGLQASTEDRVLAGAQAILGAIGLGAGLYSGWKGVEGAQGVASKNVNATGALTDAEAGALVERGGVGAKATVNVRSASFADEAKLIGHFEKHGAEFGAKSSTEYLQVGKDIMQGGDKVQYLYKGEMRTGYVQFMGNSSRGDAKYGFVGTNSNGVITTIHVESGKSFWKMLNGDPKDRIIRPIP